MKKDIQNKHKYHTRSKVKEETTEGKNNESSDEESDWETDEELEMDDIRKLIGDIFPSNYMKNKIIKGEEQGKNIKMKKQFKKMKDKYENNTTVDEQPDTKSKKSDPMKKTNDDKSAKDKTTKSNNCKRKTKYIKNRTKEESGKKTKKSTDDKIEKDIKKSRAKISKYNDILLDKNVSKYNECMSHNPTNMFTFGEEEDEQSDSETETESEAESCSDTNSDSYSDEDESSEDEIIKFGKSAGGIFDIILSSVNKVLDEEESDAESESESETETESESEEETDKKKKRKKKQTDDDESDGEDGITDLEAFSKVRNIISGLSDKDKKNKVIKKMMNDFEERESKYNKKEKKRTQKVRNKNAEKFQKVIKEKNSLNDTKFFRDKLSVEEQTKVLLEMEELKKHMDIDKPYRLTLIDADIPVIYKSIAFKKINSLKYMDEGGSEYYKIKNWVDTFMEIPFSKYKNIPLTIDDGVEKCHDFMEKSKQTLDDAVYGMDDAKLQIMQMVGQWIANPEAVGSAIAIKGPMGTGKTTLVKDGISKILGREFAFIALGGATDSSFLEGHSYTYEGSTWGKIVDILIKCKSMNPVIYFDELDKVSETPKGEEINGILTHLTDTTQNSKFHDKYFSELDFDLSRCLFIFSYNDETKVNPVLRDRMYRIQTKGYDVKQKTIIAKNYLIPKIKEQVKFETDDIVISDDVIKHIIDKYTESEQGVRNLKRCLEIIHTKLNLYRLMKPDTNLFEKDMNLKVEFPIMVSNEMVDKMIKITEETGNWKNMYM
jgi:ATP-dependent Lon protease